MDFAEEYDDADLSEVTKKFLSPIPVHSHDYLFVAASQKLTHLGLRIKPLVAASSPTKRIGGQTYKLGEKEMADHWDSASAASRQLWKRLPEVRYHEKSETYRTPATSFALEVINRSWPREQLVFVNETAQQIFRASSAIEALGHQTVRRAAEFKLSGTVPKPPDCWRERAEARLSPYQQTATCLALRSDAFALFMDRGTGKTACFIQRVCTEAQLLSSGQMKGGVPRRGGGRMMLVLVLCPAQVRLNWQREFEKFATVPGKVAVIRGDKATRVNRIAEVIAPEDDLLFSVAVVSYDSARTTLEWLQQMPWDITVADESHFFKDRSSLRWKTAITLRDSSKRRQILTGSPIGNTPMDLWAQLEFLREGASGFSTFKAFKDFHGIWKQHNYYAQQGVAKLIGLKHVPLLQERLARMSFSVTKEEAGLMLPDKVRSVVEVEMSLHQAKVYSRVSEELALELKDSMGKVVDEMTIGHVLTKLLRLAQITSGFITFDGKVDPDGNVLKQKRVEELAPTNPKVDALMELLQDPERDPRAKTIVWCNFIQNIERISGELTKAGIKHGTYFGGVSAQERDKLVDAFNCDPEFKVLVCNPQTAAEGLNLLGYDTRNPGATDTYCDLEVFFSSNWSAILRSQAEDRAHRRGTRMPVQVVDLIVPGTIDEEIMKRVNGKLDMAASTLNLREVLRSVLNLTEAA
jgi:hypothetical protein